jgi:DNA-binding beta-propeller fold protein YncE
MYMTQQTPGKVVEITANSNSVTDIVLLPGAAGMVADPQTGHLFVDDTGGGRIYEVDPQAQTAKLFKNLGAAVYGLALSADGQTLYAALYAANQVAGL